MGLFRFAHAPRKRASRERILIPSRIVILIRKKLVRISNVESL